jgi:hypothetical protein
MLVYGAAMKGFANDDLGSVMFAGGIAGLCYAIPVCPFEMVKCNTQGTQVPLRQTFARLQSKHGSPILYRGFSACCLRDAGQTSAYYGFAEMFGRNERLQTAFGDRTPFVVGMLTGILHCSVELPIDTVKTRMQTNLAYTSYREVLNEMFKDGPILGVRQLFKGYLPWMARAMICHGTGFYLITKARDKLEF